LQSSGNLLLLENNLALLEFFEGIFNYNFFLVPSFDLLDDKFDTSQFEKIVWRYSVFWADIMAALFNSLNGVVERFVKVPPKKLKGKAS